MRNSVESRLLRALALMAWLHERDPVPVEDLCAQFDVTRRQLMADLAAVETMTPDDWVQPARVVHDADADTIEIPSVPAAFHRAGQLTRDEAFAVLAVGRTALELAGPEGAPALASALEKLDAALELGRELEIDVHEPGALAAVRQAIEACETLEIDYWSAWRDELTTRRIEPWTTFTTMGDWHLVAHDRLRGEARHFRVDRILGCRATGERFTPPEEVPSPDVFVDPTTETARQVRIRLPADATWVPEYVEGEVTELDDGIEMVVTAVGDSWLERLLLRTGGEVVSPPEMVGLRRRAAGRLLERYRAG